VRIIVAGPRIVAWPRQPDGDPVSVTRLRLTRTVTVTVMIVGREPPVPVTREA
jgi:hypothetical protein